MLVLTWWTWDKVTVYLVFMVRYNFVYMCHFEGARSTSKPETPVFTCTLIPISMCCCMSDVRLIKWFRYKNSVWHHLEESDVYNMYVLKPLYIIISLQLTYLSTGTCIQCDIILILFCHQGSSTKKNNNDHIQNTMINIWRKVSTKSFKRIKVDDSSLLSI